MSKFDAIMSNFSHNGNAGAVLVDEEYNVTLNSVIWLRKMQCLYAYPFLMAMGLFCNFLSLLTIIRRGLARRNPAFLCLGVLGVADSLVLLVSCGRYTARAWLTFDIETTARWLCRFWMYLEYCSSDLAIWVLVLLSAQRCFIILVPFGRMARCSSRTVTFLIMVFILCLSKNGIILWLADIHEIHVLGHVGKVCHLRFHKVFWTTFSWIDLVIKFLLPCPFMVFFTMVMYQAMKRSEKRRLRDLVSYICNDTSAENLIFQSDTRRVLPTLLAINIVFLLCYAPFSIFMAIEGLFRIFDTEDILKYHILLLIFQTTLTLIYVSHSVNFFLYLLSGEYFREQLLAFLLCKPTFRTPVCSLWVSRNRSTSGSPKLRIQAQALLKSKTILNRFDEH